MDEKRLYELADKWNRGSLSAEEFRELNQLYRENLLPDEDIVLPEDFVTNWDSHQQMLWTAINTGIAEGKAPVRNLDSKIGTHVRKWYKYAVAAAIILIVSAGSYFWMSGTSVENSLANNDKSSLIIPGTERAILTLADGSEIILDSTIDGTVAHQGNAQIVKLSNGKIAYDLAATGQQQVFINTMRTPKGGRYQIVLPDGSKVWLNAESSITYPAAFGAADRKVKITGEVYFEVANDAQRPFLIDVDNRSAIRVLGTSFNVNSYTNEADIKTTLISGSVKINAALVLKPGQQGVTTGSDVVLNNNPNISQALAWKNGMFNFDRADIQTVMRRIERWYDVKVVYEGAIPDTWLMGKIPMNTSIDRVLDILGEIGVKFRIEGKKIIITN